MTIKSSTELLKILLLLPKYQINIQTFSQNKKFNICLIYQKFPMMLELPSEL